MRTMRLHPLGICGWTAIMFGGCSNAPPPVKSPQLNIKQAARQAVAEYDVDGDGVLGPADFAEHPQLGRAIAEADDDGDQKITADELEDHMYAWRRGKGVSAQTLQVRVTMRGAPVPGAEVTLAPFDFLGEEFVAAKGITDQDGYATMVVPPENRPDGDETLQVMWGGFYRVSVAPGENPRLGVPEKWGEKSEEGLEVGPTQRLRSGSYSIDLAR